MKKSSYNENFRSLTEKLDVANQLLAFLGTPCRQNEFMEETELGVLTNIHPFVFHSSFNTHGSQFES